MGQWTDIVQIVAPASAGAGELVSITARIKNLGDFGFFISPSGIFDGTEFSFTPEYAGVDPGATYSFSGSFIMPPHDVRVVVYSFFWTGTEWALDDEDSVDIPLAVPPEEFKGTISRKELEYDGARANIPAHNIPQGERGLVHIWGRNDMATAQKLGIHWIVKDPDGIVVREYVDWAFGYYQPGRDHEFIGGRFDLDKPGTYTLWVGLMMNYDDPEYVDIYSGNLCTVPVAEEFAGTISRKELEYDEAQDNIPVFDIPQGQRGLVHIWGRNDMSTTQRMGIWWQVKDPSGRVVEEAGHAEWEGWPYTSPGDDHEFIGGRFNLDKVGTYTIAIQLFMNPDDEVVVDDYYGNLCTVAAAVPEPAFRGFGVTEYVTV